MRRNRTARPALVALALVALGFPAQASAEAVVRSGEHPGHSRLVIEFDTLPAWQLDPRPGGFALRFDPPPAEISLDQVFYFIPRTRLADLRIAPDASGLFLDLGCDCPIEASLARNRALVIDIKDPEPDPEGGILAMTDGPVSLLAGTVPDPTPEPPPEQGAPSFSPIPEPQPEAPILPFTGSLAPDALPLGAGLTRALSEELARAAAQGMVEPDRERWRAEQARARDEADRSADVGLSADDFAAAPQNIRIRTGLDDALDPAAEEDLPAVTAELACPKPSEYAIVSWAPDGSVHREIGSLRTRLVGEFDRPNHSVARQLARLYVYLGFGAEARSVVAQFLPEDSASEAIVHLSRLVESGSAGGALAPYSGCAGSLPLWAILDEDPDQPLRPVETEKVLMTFSSLPPHLRRYMAYALSTRFAAREDYSSAEIVRAAVERISAPDDPALVLSTVQATPVEDVGRAAEAALAELAVSLRPEAAEALLVNIDGRLTRGERIPVDLIDTAAALGFELSGSEVGRRVKAAEIRGRLANGDFDAAFVELQTAPAEHGFSEAETAAVWAFGLDRLADRADDVTLVEQVFGPLLAPGLGHAPDRVTGTLAERLLGLGFPDRAEEIAPEGFEGEDGLFGVRLTRARGDLDTAIRMAGEMSGETARRLLADLLSEAGRHAEAREAYAEIGDAEGQRMAAWRAGLWSEVAGEDEGARAGAATAMLGLAADRAAGAGAFETTTGPPTIAESEALVGESTSLRETLSALLEATPAPDS